jgi:hypothetical protein
MQLEELEAGSTALVVGPRRERRSFCLRHLVTAGRTAVAVLPSDPSGTVEEYDRLGGEAPLTLLREEGTVDGPADEVPGVRVVDVAADSLPAVGEATLGTLEADESGDPADRLWLAGLPELLERASVQQVYRLLYVLSKHVRKADGVGLYALDESVEPKTARILCQPLDYEVTLAPESTPEIRTLAGRSDDG